MKRYRFILSSILAVLIIGLGFFLFSNNKLSVEMGEYNPNYQKTYPPNSFISFQNKKYLIQLKYKYSHHFLSEYWSIGSEGYAVQKFSFPFEMNYDKIRQPYKFLNYTKKGDSIIYNYTKYKILEKRKDTIISSNGENHIILFIEK